MRRAILRIGSHHPLPRRRRGQSSSAADLDMVTVALLAADHGAAEPGTDRPRITIIPAVSARRLQPLEHLRTRRSPGSAVTASLMPDAKYPRNQAVPESGTPEDRY